ncbi:hypothetical protein K474DRAFT_1590696 [Panus rudis PR-1116 ss-1]|nr:hypothetical protein K474DRAFT_1590696 [Panus rudis PR-1116 ss-1]
MATTNGIHSYTQPTNHAHTTVDDPVEVIFLGTGTSSGLPQIDCLTAPPNSKPCRTCLSTLQPDGRKNIRRNTSVAMRVRDKDGVKRTILIDVGKTFQAAALEWFPKYGLRKIDAVLITHAHADAMNGLDDLRGWTLRGAIQDHVDVYVSQDTFKEVQRAFPYLVCKEFASGGGDVSVPEFKWHIIEDKTPFQLGDTGITVKPFNGKVIFGSPVHHSATLQGTGDIKPIQPYPCLGFIVQDTVAYISDVSHIPEEVWDFIKPPSDKPGPSVLILDCLKLKTHTSHLGFGDAVEYARRFDAQRTYLIGFGHEVSHDEYITLGEAVGGKIKSEAELTENEKLGLAAIKEGKQIWLRPSFDGLRVFVDDDGKARDEEYN